MPYSLNELIPYLAFAVPPLLGAFIGYLTNRVAIRMLFRPLKRWKIGPFKIPMTPGVIPSKRHDLAVNIGEMVGEHLLTSTEINNSLKKEAFQHHLYSLIETKIGSFLKQDLGPLPSLVPSAYRNYFDIAYKTSVYQIKDTINRHLQSELCREAIEKALDQWLDDLLARKLNTIVSSDDRQIVYHFFESTITRLFTGSAMEKWISEFVEQKFQEAIQRRQSLRDILPDSLHQLLIETISNQTPYLLQKGAEIIKEPHVRDKIIVTVRRAVDDFITKLGPMGSMVKGFLDMEDVEDKMRHYFSEKEDEIGGWLDNEEVKVRLAAALSQRAEKLLATPLADLTVNLDTEVTSAFTAELARQLTSLIRQPQTAQVISAMLKDTLEASLAHGELSSGEIAREMLGEDGIDKIRHWLKTEVVAISRSAKTRQAIDGIIETLLADLMRKPVGRLAHLIPAGVREGLYRSVQEMATNMLISEVPGIVKSLNIRQIVSDRIDSFDLLRLEKLLLSIMEDQFKYINLFGALLGFLIGCANLVFLVFF